MNFSAVKDTGSVFYSASVDRNRDAAKEIELRVYMLAAGLAIKYGWSLREEDFGKEILRHAAHLALARYLDHRLWESCQSCVDLSVWESSHCLVCCGSRCRFLPLDDFVLLVGEQYNLVWLDRINKIACEIQKWYREMAS